MKRVEYPKQQGCCFIKVECPPARAGLPGDFRHVA